MKITTLILFFVALTGLAFGQAQKTPSSGITIDISQLRVNGSTPTNGWVLTWNSSIGRFVAAAPTGGGGGGSYATVMATDLYFTNLFGTVPDANIAGVHVTSQTGTNYTLTAVDRDGIVIMSNASANTVAIPPNSSVAFAGKYVQIVQGGAGPTSVAAGSGVTIRNVGSNTIGTLYGSLTLIPINIDEWLVVGAPITQVNADWNATSGAAQILNKPAPQTTITGNAGTATALQTPRTIDGVSFDGTANISTVRATNAVAALDIDWNASSGTHSKTLSANTTFTFSNVVDGKTIIVAVTNTASNYTVTWPTVSWPGGTAPTQTVGAKTDIYTFVRIGSTTFGTVVQNF
jgi:hypothetical protein